jgi:predicted ester cyclase
MGDILCLSYVILCEHITFLAHLENMLRSRMDTLERAWERDTIYAVTENSELSLRALHISDGTILWQTQVDSLNRITSITLGEFTDKSKHEKTSDRGLDLKGMDPLLTEANRVRVQQFFEEVLNKRNVALAEQLLDANYVSHSDGYLSGLPTGLEGFKYLISLFHRAFPDGHFDYLIVQNHYAEEDLVVARYKWQGTDKGELMGFSPTGNVFTYGNVSLIRVTDGKIIEMWRSFDRFAAYVLEPVLEKRKGAQL